LARRTLQTRAIHPPRAVSKAGAKCRVLAVATEMSRPGKHWPILDSLSNSRAQQRRIGEIQGGTKQSDLMENTMKKAISLIGLLMTLAMPSGLLAQQAGYSQTNLVSNIAGVGATTDTQLLNPWGMSVLPGQDFWIANNNSGTSTLYDQNGNKDNGLIVTIPGASSNPNGNCSPGCPTGTVANPNGTYFAGGSFIFDTEDGLIVYWNGSSNTGIVGKDNSASGAVYKGLALLGTNLLAANFNSGKVDVYDSTYNLTTLAGSFTDPKLPAGFAPHGIHVIGNQVYIAYAMQDTPKHDAFPGAGAGQVDIFDSNGNFVSTFVAAAANNNLNAPWGVTAAPASFGTFAGDILVGNFGDGTISAFDTTGKFVGQLTDSSGKVLVNPGLWDMVFGGGGGANDPGVAGTLYITAGGSAGQPNFPSGGSATAVFASLAPAAAVGSGFSLNLSAMSATVAPGGSATVMVSAAAVGGFNSQITLTCSAPAGLTCALSPSTISPGASAANSTLTISADSTPPPTGYNAAGMFVLMPGLGLFGTLLTSRKWKSLTRKRIRGLGLLSLTLAISLFALGCSGSNNSNKPTTPASQQATVMVTGTSGSLTHSSAVTVTIN
jgi:uncharacterized protein (TIGR03118 family)